VKEKKSLVPRPLLIKLPQRGHKLRVKLTWTFKKEMSDFKGRASKKAHISGKPPEKRLLSIFHSVA